MEKFTQVAFAHPLDREIYRLVAISSLLRDDQKRALLSKTQGITTEQKQHIITLLKEEKKIVSFLLDASISSTDVHLNYMQRFLKHLRKALKTIRIFHEETIEQEEGSNIDSLFD